MPFASSQKAVKNHYRMSTFYSLSLPSSYHILSCSSNETADDDDEEEEDRRELRKQLQGLCERVATIEDKLGKGEYQALCEVHTGDLYEARIDYSNEVTRQWNELRIVLRLRPGEVKHTGGPIIVNKRILSENECRIIYKGYKCEPIPFTHCTLIKYVGELKFSMHLEAID